MKDINKVIVKREEKEKEIKIINKNIFQRVTEIVN